MKKLIQIAIIFFIIVELIINFLQYYYTPIDGDLVAIALPAEWYSKVLEDPTGLKTISGGELIGGAGRYMAHLTMYTYYHYVPEFLQTFISPIESVYVASAIFKLLTVILLLVAFTLYNKFHFGTKNKIYLLTPILILPLIQYYGFYDVMRTVDQATTYVFFYLWPVSLFLILYFPIYKWISTGGKQRITSWQLALMVPASVYISLDGPLMPPLFILAGVFSLLIKWSSDKNIVHVFKMIQTREVLFLLFTIIFSFYAYYLSTFNVESVPVPGTPDLKSRYLLMLQGIYILLTYDAGLSLLLVYTIILTLILLKSNPKDYEAFKKTHLILIILAMVYIMLLPLGGYRSYRPYVIRSDTSIPALMILMLIFTQVNFLAIQTFRPGIKRIFSFFLPFLLLIYFVRDIRIKKGNLCEKEGLEIISNAKTDTVRLNNPCNIMSWEPQTNPYFTHFNSQMLQVWNITDHYQPYLQVKEK